MFKVQNNKYDLGDTQIPNIFLNDFMPGANGDFVKVYLLGYKFARENRGDISNENIADFLGILESDVLRAWQYWKKMGIVNIDEKNNVEFVDLKELYITNVYNLKKEKKKEKGYSQVVENPTIANLLTRVEFLMREPIPPMKKLDIANWITAYNMPAELIEEAFFYATEVKGIYKINYVEQIVRNWAQDNVRTMEDIEKSYMEHDIKYMRYAKVMRYIGLSKKQFTQVDFNIVNSWFDEFGYDFDVVLAACNRTSKIQNPNVNYVDAILRNWKKLGINSVEEIEEKDKQKRKRKPTAFHNFKQITDSYTDDELEDVAMKKQREGFKKLGVDYGTSGEDK
ncbi:DnaD domain-containing protein [Peptoniphilus sp.]|jgi:DnaD/phage-associated family protein|uniref:DnaD domain-containing protein n=1 Tax=Peptoniphilus sp. TaxID=1971214 RepID=UPI003D8C886A